MYNGQDLDVDGTFVYLGTMFSYNGHFIKNNQRLYDQARKAMFAVLSKSTGCPRKNETHFQFIISLKVFNR